MIVLFELFIALSISKIVPKRTYGEIKQEFQKSPYYAFTASYYYVFSVCLCYFTSIYVNNIHYCF